MLNYEMLSTINAEELQACAELITKMREERRQKEIFEKNRKHLRSVVTATIDAIGLEDTKVIICEINKDLRDGYNE